MKNILLAMIRFYRKYISPTRPPCCRFIPTCSQYAMEAIEKYGALKGGWLALCRVSDAILSITESTAIMIRSPEEPEKI
jgi:putative membrane protein insertion efficiency factor